jgi:hypothetical protein
VPIPDELKAKVQRVLVIQVDLQHHLAEMKRLNTDKLSEEEFGGFMGHAGKIVELMKERNDLRRELENIVEDLDEALKSGDTV